MNKILIANWKMNGSINMLNEYINQVMNLPVTLVLPTIYLSLTHSIIDKQPSLIKLASQEVSIYKDHGPYTGQISATMLQDLEVEYILIGHSELRNYFQSLLNTFEASDWQYNKLINAYLKDQLQNSVSANITPIFCIGESIEHRIADNYYNVLLEQLAILNNLGLNDIIVAYEPVWAIGSGMIPSQAQISEVSLIIKSFFTDNYPNINYKIIYGGSVNSDNISNIVNIDNIDGVLVGGTALKWENLQAMCWCIQQDSNL